MVKQSYIWPKNVGENGTFAAPLFEVGVHAPLPPSPMPVLSVHPVGTFNRWCVNMYAEVTYEPDTLYCPLDT